MKIIQFDKAICKAIHEKAVELLKPLEDEYGIKLQRKGGRFCAESYGFKIEWNIVNAEGESVKAESEWNIGCALLGLESKHFKETFTFKNRSYEIVGLNLNSVKFPINCKRDDGKEFRFPERVIKNALGIVENQGEG